MPAHTFGLEWLDPLLRGDKQGTTRPQSTRIKVGDIVHIYNQQRRRIADKPMRTMTELGREMIRLKRAVRYDIRTYPPVHPDTWVHGRYYAHFLGKVRITEVYDIHPCEMSRTDMEMWARADGFAFLDVAPAINEMGHRSANDWFTQRYGDDWTQRWWTVERWDGWQERYFEPTQMMPYRGCEDAYGNMGSMRMGSSE